MRSRSRRSVGQSLRAGLGALLVAGLGVGCSGSSGADDGAAAGTDGGGTTGSIDGGDGGGRDGDDAGSAGDAAPASCRASTGEFPPAWIRGGPDCGSEVAIQIHRYDRDTFILRQSLCTSFEAPFMVLLFGQDRALLEDTGAGGIQIADAVLGIIDQVMEERGQRSIELVVASSHGHGDHIAGNEQFEGMPGVTVVGYTIPEITDFFSIAPWPEGISSIDLGGRVVDVVPIPGHQGADIALFDRAAGLLLTGDTLYPGRLYIREFDDYRASIDRLVQFAGDVEVCWVLGAHIEMSATAGDDYPTGATSHPDEHALELSVDQLTELQSALAGMGDQPVREVHDDFIVFPL